MNWDKRSELTVQTRSADQGLYTVAAPYAYWTHPELQIRGDIVDKSKIIFLISQ